MNDQIRQQLSKYMIHTGYYDTAKIRESEGMDSHTARYLAIFGSDDEDVTETTQSDLLTAALEFNAAKEQADIESEQVSNTAETLMTVILSDEAYQQPTHPLLRADSPYDEDLTADQRAERRQLKHQLRINSISYRVNHMLETERQLLAARLVKLADSSLPHPFGNRVLYALQDMNLANSNKFEEDSAVDITAALRYIAGVSANYVSEPEE